MAGKKRVLKLKKTHQRIVRALVFERQEIMSAANEQVVEINAAMKELAEEYAEAGSLPTSGGRLFFQQTPANRVELIFEPEEEPAEEPPAEEPEPGPALDWLPTAADDEEEVQAS